MAKILVIEDNAVMRDMIKVLLKKEGHTVVVAVNGPAGLSAVRSEKPDLILLDFMMPSMNGEEVATFLHNDPQTQSIPIIVLTSVSQPEQVRSMVALGVRDYLLKPVDATTLRDRIKVALAAPPPEQDSDNQTPASD